MQTIHVTATTREYDVLIGRDLLSSVGPKARQTAGGTKAFLVTNENVSPLYGRSVSDSLAGSGYLVSSLVVGTGERIKSLKTLGEVLEGMADAGLTRDDVVVALGGGVVGDLAGFAASIYMRGCDVVQVPTSLLAMVDSSVGGKTAIDLSHGKNLAGSFFPPAVVLVDVICLETIPHDLFTDSCGEVIKYGVMADAELFDDLSSHPLNKGKLDFQKLERVITKCIDIKRGVVEKDEYESGIRQTLNLGHTIGHSIEVLSKYEVGHGSCVAAGMCYMARACAKLGVCSTEAARKIESTVSSYGLPINSSFGIDELWTAALADKKRHQGGINVVLIEDIGSVRVKQLGLDDFKRLIELGA